MYASFYRIFYDMTTPISWEYPENTAHGGISGKEEGCPGGTALLLGIIVLLAPSEQIAQKAQGLCDPPGEGLAHCLAFLLIPAVLRLKLLILRQRF